MVELHPFIQHYETYTGPAGGSADATCDPVGTIGNPAGAWNAFTGNSGGFQPWKVDLSAYAGKQVEVSITYISDVGRAGPRRVRRRREGDRRRRGRSTPPRSRTVSAAGASRVRPTAARGNGNDWIQTASVGYVDGPGVATKHTVYWGFGLEGVTGADTRATLVKDALAQLGVSG